MNNTSKWILAAIVVLIASGCQNAPKFSNQRDDAHQRWSNARASVVLRVAENRLASGALDDAEKAAGQALQLDPNSQEARIIMARVLIEKSRFTEASDLLNRVCQAYPQDAKAAYYLGVAQEKSGRLEESLDTYRRAYGLDESDLSPVKASAEVLVALGRQRAALVQIESYLPKAPDDTGMFELAGRLALMCKEHDKAVEYLQRVRDLDCQNVHYCELLARAQFAAGRHAQLVDNLTELLGRKNYEAPTWVYLMLGDAYLAQGQGRNAFDAYFTASEREPKQVEVWLSLSRAALTMNDLPRAVGSAQRALMLSARDVNAQLLLGCALLKDSQPARAVLVLTDAAADHPENSTVQCLLGRAHVAMGQRDQAAKCYAEALRLDPGSEVAKQLIQASIDGEDVSKIR